VRARLLIVDDHEPFLSSARRLLDTDDLQVVGVASSATEALILAKEHDPDVALVDVDLRGESGFELARELLNARPRLRVILLSTHSEEDIEDLVAESPAVGFLAKSRLTPAAVREVAGYRESR
jgi:two-component system, NarL family, nitrate/nitrite response regulator NarL